MSNKNSLGWLTENTIIPTPGKKIEGVSSKTTQLIKSSIESGGKIAVKYDSDNQNKSINASKLNLTSNKKQQKRVSNKGIEKRIKRDEKDFVKESLQIKKQFYDKLSKKRFKGDDKFLVNFEEKELNEEQEKQTPSHFLKAISAMEDDDFKQDSNEEKDGDESTDEERIRREEEETLEKIRKLNRAITKINNKDDENKLKDDEHKFQDDEHKLKDDEHKFQDDENQFQDDENQFQDDIKFRGDIKAYWAERRKRAEEKLRIRMKERAERTAISKRLWQEDKNPELAFRRNEDGSYVFPTYESIVFPTK